MVVFALGGLFFVGALALPLAALWRFAVELGLTAHVLVEVRYVNLLSALAMTAACGYVGLATAREARRPA